MHEIRITKLYKLFGLLRCKILVIPKSKYTFKVDGFIIDSVETEDGNEYVLALEPSDNIHISSASGELAFVVYSADQSGPKEIFSLYKRASDCTVSVSDDLQLCDKRRVVDKQ